MQNPDIARVFDEVADLLEIQDANPFRVRAYRNAARTIRDFPEPIAELVRSGAKDLTDIPGIGEDLAEKITAIVTAGELPLRRQLAAKLPAGLLDLLRIPGLGPKRVKLLYKKLKVKSAADLAKVLDAGKVQKLKGFGPKIEEKMRAGLGQAQVTERRMLLNEAETQANAIVAHVKEGGGVRQIEVAGSDRRRRETIGDLDILVTSGDSARVMDRFITYGEVTEVVSKGETRSTVKLRGGLQVDLRAVEPAAYGAAGGLKYEYIAITDHSKRVTMALGLDAKRLREQWRAIDEWNAGPRGALTILKSVELDILETGKLDLPDDVLAEADYVVATIHYGTDQPERQLTRRLVGAAEHRWIDAIGHPTGRRLGKREPYRFDFDALARACAAAGCLLELNGHPERMDLPDTLAAAAKQHGVRFVLSTDSHQPNNLPFMKYAVDLARRAGLEAGDILNTRPLAGFRKGLKRGRGKTGKDGAG